MSERNWRARNLMGILGMAILGGVIGQAISTTRPPRPAGVDPANVFPLPHHIPKYPDGISLRFAMAHDVIHERFPKHGKAYYEERNRRVSQAIKEDEAKRGADGKPPAAYWALVDDLAVGLDLLGKHEDAVALMEKKLKQQQESSLAGPDLYSTYANWGTFLILWQIQEGFADKDKAKERIKESIQLIHKAIDVKPDSHFGREIWQAVLEEFLLELLDTPELLLKYDMIGNRLDQDIAPGRRSFDSWGGYAHRLAKGHLENAKQERTKEAAEQFTKEAEDLRKHITKVGGEEGWRHVLTSHKEPVAFDEPTLGIIGMWRYGGGANPHFALALGEIMLRVGQRYVAWTAYERAFEMADGLGESISPKFKEHCRKRQKVIESQLPANEGAELRPRFVKELAFGKRSQQAYQEYEEKRIKEGASIDDPHFYDAFHATHKPIASPIGQEDSYVVAGGYWSRNISIPAMLLFAGIFAFATACLLLFLHRRSVLAAEPAEPD